jgi:hypothetical protein
MNTDYTANGVEIVVGLKVWNNNLERCEVAELSADGWHKVVYPNGQDDNFNAERMTTRHPFTGEIA